MRNNLWIVVDTIATAAVSLLTVLLLARFVDPESFGLASLIIGATLLVNLYVEGLFHDALIQNRDGDDSLFALALWLVLATALGLVLLSLAGWVVLSAYGQGQLGGMIVAVAASLPFSAIVGVNNARERHRLSYRKVAIASIGGRTFACAMALLMGVLGWEVWSLLLQVTITSATQALLLIALIRWFPGPAFNVGALGGLLRFALPYALMHTVAGLRLQVFTFLLAGFSGLAAAGYLNVAFRLTITPQTVLNTALMNFGFPLLSARKGSKADLTTAFATVTMIACVGGAAPFVGLALVAPALVPVAFGPGWDGVVLPVQVLCIGAAIGFLRINGSFLLRALGHVRYSLYNALFQLAATVAAMAVIRPEDAMGGALIWAAPVLLTAPLTWTVVARVAGIGPFEQARNMAGPVAAILLMVAAVMTFEAAVPLPPVASIIASSAIGGMALLVALYATNKEVRQFAERFFGRQRPAE